MKKTFYSENISLARRKKIGNDIKNIDIIKRKYTIISPHSHQPTPPYHFFHSYYLLCVICGTGNLIDLCFQDRRREEFILSNWEIYDNVPTHFGRMLTLN